jgi:hypothetical protein
MALELQISCPRVVTQVLSVLGICLCVLRDVTSLAVILFRATRSPVETGSEKSHRALVSHTTTIAVISSAPVAGSAPTAGSQVVMPGPLARGASRLGARWRRHSGTARGPGR